MVASCTVNLMIFMPNGLRNLLMSNKNACIEFKYVKDEAGENTVVNAGLLVKVASQFTNVQNIIF